MIKLKELTNDELNQMMEFMASNRKDHKPKVGIFWYDTENDKIIDDSAELPKDSSKLVKFNITTNEDGVYIIGSNNKIMIDPEVRDLVVIKCNLPGYKTTYLVGDKWYPGKYQE